MMMRRRARQEKAKSLTTIKLLLMPYKSFYEHSRNDSKVLVFLIVSHCHFYWRLNKFDSRQMASHEMKMTVKPHNNNKSFYGILSHKKGAIVTTLVLFRFQSCFKKKFSLKKFASHASIRTCFSLQFPHHFHQQTALLCERKWENFSRAFPREHNVVEKLYKNYQKMWISLSVASHNVERLDDHGTR